MMAYFHVSTRKISDKISSGDTSGPVSILWSEQAPFTAGIVGLILRTHDTYVKRVSQRSTRKSRFLPQGMLTGWVGISPLTDPSTVVVFRDLT
jgi:hypothetical protein